MKKRILSRLLALILLLELLPGQTMGAGYIIEPNLEETCVNPLYSGVITEEELLDEFSKLPAQGSQEETANCTTAKQVAEVIRNGMEKRETVITISYTVTDDLVEDDIRNLVALALEETGVPTQGDYLRWVYGGYHFSATGKNTAAGIIYEMRFLFSYYTTEEQEDQLTKKIQEVLDSLDFTEYTSDPEKIRAIYDYICSHVTYDYDNLEDENYKLKFTAYAALMDGTAVCQGYAVLLYRMLMEENISTRLIAGSGNGGTHAWNIVRIGEKYYNLDSTWDAGRDVYRYYLKCEANFEDHLRDGDYQTVQFQVTYPVALVDYADVPGDINGDGQVNAGDLRCLMKRVIIHDSATILDLNGDHQVDTRDVIRLMKYLTDPTVSLN